jgi:hypothetical protein
MMRSNRKVWLGVGAFVVAGAGASAAPGLQAPSGVPALVAPHQSPFLTDTAIPPASTGGFVLAQHGDHAKEAPAEAPKEPGKEGGEGGESKGIENLPPELAFAARIALLRGHLLVGDQLVKQQQWNAALPHFLHPSEEIYGDIKDSLPDYKVPAFDAALKTLADVVKAKKGADYARALKAVTDALATADIGMKDKQADNWPGYVTEAAVEAIKTAAGEYQNAIVGSRIGKPVEYQDARGFILEADRMIEGVAPALQKKDAASLKEVRATLAELKKLFPTAVPPRTPVKDHAAMLAIVARLELAASKLM